MDKHKSGRFLIHEMIDPKEYVYKFDISPLLKDEPLLCVMLLWPDGELEALLVQLGATKEYVSFPVPRSRLSNEDFLRNAEELTGKPLTVKHCSVTGPEFYFGVEGKMFKYLTDFRGLDDSVEGEAAGVYLRGLRHYYFAYLDFNQRVEWSPRELSEFISVYPEASNFSRIKEKASNFFFQGRTPKLERGQQSLAKREKTRVKKYALYNLVQSKANKGHNINDTLIELSAFFEDEFELKHDLDVALKRAYYRAKKEIESPQSTLSTHIIFRKLEAKKQKPTYNAYALLALPFSK